MLALVAVLAAGAEADRTVARAQAHLKRGREMLDKSADAKGAQKLRALRRANYYLSQADTLSAKTTDVKLQGEVRGVLVDSLVRTAAAYYERKSLPSAKKTVLRAIALDSSNARANALLAGIKRAEDDDIFDSVDGVVGIDRVRARRLAAGVPLRDRGVARRR